MEFEVESFRFKDTRNESEYILEFLKKKKKNEAFSTSRRREEIKIEIIRACIEIDNNNEIIKIINVLNSRVTTL